MRKSHGSWRFLVVCLFAAISAWGQAGTNSGVIAGEVNDSSGAKVSGARVTVISPALIEQARETVTGDDGLYRIVNLPPGVYEVTATQTGFSVAKREGVEITTGFTATLNFKLTPGSVTQTVTVTSEAPILDTQDSVVQKVISNTVLEALPIGKSATDYPALLPGAIAPAANQDVGGLKGEQTQGFRIHGSSATDFTQLRDGMYYGAMTGGGSNQLSSNNPTATQEVQFETGGYTAEDWNNGGHVNIIPRNGGNDLHGAFQADFGHKALQSSNVTPALQGLGVPSPSSIRSLYEVAGGVGGPIKKDKLWFFADARHWVSSSYQAGANFFYDANEAAPFPSNLYYAADPSRPAYDINTYTDVGLRLTWQATKRNQFTENFIQERNCNCFYTIGSGLLAPEAATHHYYLHDWRDQVTWTFPVNNKLVLWAGFTAVVSAIDTRSSGETPTSFAVTDSSANFTYGANGINLTPGGTYGLSSQTQLNGNFTASYTTGPHAFKFGFSELSAIGSRVATFGNPAGANGFPYGVQLQMQCQAIDTSVASIDPKNGLPLVPYHTVNTSGTPSAAAFASPVGAGAGQIAPATVNSLLCPTVSIKNVTYQQALLPSQIMQFLAPFDFSLNTADHALFAQDQWRIKRLTLNLGLRFDWFQGKDSAQTEPAQPQFGLPARSFAAQNSAADWKDINPRLGAAYDLFGNGKTALKVSISRGVITEGLTAGSNITLLTNPVNELASSTTRNWTDFSGTFNPLLDGANFTSAGASGGLGAATVASFYNPSPAANVTYANNVTHGFQNRPYDWMLSASVQQEVLRNVAVSIGYYRTWFGNLTVAQNTAIPAAGYDQYCVTPPASTAYPGVGGTALCNLYDPQPRYAGKASYLVQKASNFGKESDVYTGIDAIVSARLHGLLLQGGVTAGHEVTNYCVQVNSPEDLFWYSNPSPGASSILEFSNNNATNNSSTQGNVTPLVNDATACYINPPWYQNLQFKMIAVYTLPLWKIKLSANEQNLPSIPLQATYSFRSANVSFVNPAPGHTTLVGCTLCRAEALTPQTIYPFGRDNQLDFRIAKDINITERWKLQPTADFFNVLNANPILTIGSAYNTSPPGTPGAWRNATSVLPGRLIKFGLHLDF